MEKITNFKLKDFFKQDIELIKTYVKILQLLEPIQTKNEVYHLKLKDVEFIKQYLFEDDDEALIEIISIVQELNQKEVLNLEIIEVFGILNSIKEQIERINNAEVSSLTSDNINIKFEAVNGAERLKQFGIYNILNNLSNGDILKWNSIMELPYSDVFMKLLLDKTNNDIQSEMNNIKSQI